MSILSNTLQAAAKVYALESQGVQEAQEDNVSVESQPPFTTQLRWNSAMAVTGHSQAGVCPQSSPICSNSFADGLSRVKCWNLYNKQEKNETQEKGFPCTFEEEK